MRICLCMIVKNESRIIERCLDSAKPIIDFVSICDTGSTDNTSEVIENWCHKNGISGIIHKEPFKDFGYNRTLSARLAEEAFPEADYLLLLDADMILEMDSFNKDDLYLPGYMLMQYSREIKYWNTRLIKTSMPWECHGVTHEFWRLEGFGTGVELNGLYIDDREDGGGKSDKFQRDERLLLSAIKDPTITDELKTRYTFYLAQTYYCLGQWSISIEWYKKRIDAGGWQEEVYYSLTQIGRCYENSKDLPNAIYYFSKAWNYRPKRAEALYHISRIYRENEQYSLSTLFALKGKEISFPKGDILFIDYHVYDYLFDYELSISAFYVDRSLGLDAQNRLMSNIEGLPLFIAESVKQNNLFYV